MIKETTKKGNTQHHAVKDAAAKGITVDPTKSKFNTASKSSAINPNSKLVCDPQLATKHTHKFSGQLAIILDMLEQNGNSLNMQEANDYWITNYVDTGVYTQDLVTVVSHYRGVFNSNKGYKHIPRDELTKLITIS